MARVAVLLIFVAVAVGATSVATDCSKMQPSDCKANEKYYECSLEQCYKDCKDLKNPPACPAIAPGCVQPACLCADNMLRNDQNECVPVEQCPEYTPSDNDNPAPSDNDTPQPFDCKANEKYYECSLEQCYTDCKDLKNPPACPAIAPGCVQPACLCADNMLRNDQNECVPVEQCPEYTPSDNDNPAPSDNDTPQPFDCKANEKYYECSLEQCYTACKDLKNPPACPAIAPGCVQPACLCADNMLRNDQNECVPVEQCPEYTPSDNDNPAPSDNDTPQPFDCKANEKYYECSLEQCYTDCKDLKNPPACPAIAPGCVQPACLCADNMLRNDQNECVPVEQCPEYTPSGNQDENQVCQ